MSNESNAAQGKERHRPSTFPYKLWQLMDECTDGAIKWSAAGDSIVIDQNLFCSSIFVGKIFKSIQWPSFVRQLNLYGFRKISPHGHSQGPCVCLCHVSTIICYMHEHFRRWSYDSLTLVTRPRKQSKVGFSSAKQNKNDINGNKSQSILTSQTDYLDLSGSQELINWNEATVPIGMLKEPIANPELPEPTSKDQSDDVWVDMNVKTEHLLTTIPIEHHRFHHLESPMDTHPWTGIESSKYDEDQHFTQPISAEMNDSLTLLPEFDGAERVVMFPTMIPDISEVEIFHDDGTESMDVDVEIEVEIDVEVDYCEDIHDGDYSYDE